MVEKVPVLERPEESDNSADNGEVFEPLTEDERKILMDRLAHHVLVNRIRVCDFFTDFDKLRSGLISKSKFTRVLKTIRFNMTPRDVAAVLAYYQDDKKPDMIRWKDFTDDVSFLFFCQQ